MNKKGNAFSFIIGIATILFFAIIWVVFGYAFDSISDTILPTMPTSINGYAVNTTQVATQAGYSSNAIFIYFFVAIIVVVLWILKEANRTQQDTLRM
jgi:hypothetical protein